MENNHFTPVNSLQSSRNKDIQSDTDFTPQFNLGSLHDEIERLATESDSIPVPPELEAVLETERMLRETSKGTIQKPKPILKLGDSSIIYPRTINVIQGQAGTHKSRLVETMCSAFLRHPDCKNDLLGFSKDSILSDYMVVYVDTERNMGDQFPFAIQSIKSKAGHPKESDPPRFRFISLKAIPRPNRFKVLDSFLTYIRRGDEKTQMFIVLDVATDCISDFNKIEPSMELIDLMNVAVDKHNVCFMCLIHENPGSEKARGHFGTELMNKATMHMSVGFEMDQFNNPTDLIRIKFLKGRWDKKPAPVHVKYCDIEKGLVLADAGDVATIKANRKKSAPVEDVVEKLELMFDDGSKIPRAELVDLLMEEFHASPKTIEDRLKEIISTNHEIFNRDGVPFYLQKERQGKKMIYSAKPMENNPL
jgi:hypothetical protein